MAQKSQTRCQDCGNEANLDEHRIVGNVGPYGPVCNECWAIFLGDETILTRREADVVALKDLDREMPNRQVGNILGIEKSTVDTLWSRAREKIRLAQRTADELGALVE